MLIIFLQEHLHTIYLKNTKIRILQNYNNYITQYVIFQSFYKVFKCIEVSWVGIDIKQVAVAVDEPVGYPLPQRFIYQITFDFQRLRNSFRLTSPEAMLLPKELPSIDTAQFPFLS